MYIDQSYHNCVCNICYRDREDGNGKDGKRYRVSVKALDDYRYHVVRAQHKGLGISAAVVL